MKYILIISLLLTGLGGCEKKNITTGCDGPDRFVFKDAKAAFLESGFALLETAQDSTYVRAKVPYINCQPCSPVNLARLKVQKDNSSVSLNYLITCGMKYDDASKTYTVMPAPLIVIYSIREL